MFKAFRFKGPWYHQQYFQKSTVDVISSFRFKIFRIKGLRIILYKENYPSHLGLRVSIKYIEAVASSL